MFTPQLFILWSLITECPILECLYIVKEAGSLQGSPSEKYHSKKGTLAYSYLQLFKKENSSLLWKWGVLDL
jgi:hypothetical protein